MVGLTAKQTRVWERLKYGRVPSNCQKMDAYNRSPKIRCNRMEGHDGLCRKIIRDQWGNKIGFVAIDPLERKLKKEERDFLATMKSLEDAKLGQGDWERLHDQAIDNIRTAKLNLEMWEGVLKKCRIKITKMEGRRNTESKSDLKTQDTQSSEAQDPTALPI